MTAQPISCTCRTKRASVSSTEQPGMLSSLSSVPPVCPRPRPEIFATFAPQAAASGTSTSVVVSPTPPVECLSTQTPSMADRSTTPPECIISIVRQVVSCAFMPRQQIAISSAESW